MPHQHKAVTYKPAPLDNPFINDTDRAYADILLDKMKEAKAWRMTGFGALVLFIISIVIFVIALASQKTVPVLINVMPSGEAVNLGEVRQAGAFQVPETAVLFQARRFITNLRSVSTDGEVLYKNITECYDMASSSYEPVMTRMLRSASPFDLVGRIRRTVEIESSLHVTANTYQIDWTETSTETGGNPRSRKMRALITIKLIPPDNSFIKANPLGIFVENCEWTEL
jgi:type IV secretion system protein VirB5